MSGRDGQAVESNDKVPGLPNERQNYHPHVDVLGVLPLGGEKLPCAVAARCGGCPGFGLTTTEQRWRKGQALLAGLSERGVLHGGRVEWLVANTTGYRNRIRLALRSGVPSYFNAEKDPRCAVLEPGVVDALAAFEGWATPRSAALSNYCVAEVRTADADHRASVYLRHTQRNGVTLPAPDWAWLPEAFGDVLLAVEGGPTRLQRYLITDNVYAKIPVGAFMQINTGANRLMVQRVLEWRERSKARRVLDLFSGSGNFTLPLAQAGCEVTAIEWDSAACQALVVASSEQALQVSVSVGDASIQASALAARGETYDLVIADPPRGGLRGEVDALCALAQSGIVLVSCDADRFCKDASALHERGLELSDYVAVDMFPHTRHMEVLGLFRRRAVRTGPVDRSSQLP